MLPRPYVGSYSDEKILRDPSIKKKPGANTMHTFFYYIISEFAGNL